jgi:hypothetical protein
MNYSARAYYLREHLSAPLIVDEGAIDALLDALLTQSVSNSLLNLYIVERPLNDAGFPGHEFGVGVDAEREVGGLWYMGEGGSWYTLGSQSTREEVYYCYMNHDTSFPADSEISIDLIRQATKEFLASGGERPTCVQWQPYGQAY